MKTTHQLPAIGTLIGATEINGWDTVNSLAVKFTVAEILALDNLESIAAQTVRTLGGGSTAGGTSRNMLWGANHVQSGTGANNGIFGSGNLNSGSNCLIGGADHEAVGINHLIGGEHHELFGTTEAGFSCGLFNWQSNGIGATFGQQTYAFRFAETCFNSRAFLYNGDDQMSLVHAQGISLSDGTAKELTVAGDTIDILPDSMVSFEAHCQGIQQSGTPGTAGDVGYHVIRGVIKNLAGTTTLVGTIDDTTVAEDTNATWTWDITPDDTDDFIKITATAQNGQVVRFTAHVILNQIGFRNYGTI